MDLKLRNKRYNIFLTMKENNFFLKRFNPLELIHNIVDVGSVCDSTPY